VFSRLGLNEYRILGYDNNQKFVICTQLRQRPKVAFTEPNGYAVKADNASGSSLGLFWSSEPVTGSDASTSMRHVRTQLHSLLCHGFFARCVFSAGSFLRPKGATGPAQGFNPGTDHLRGVGSNLLTTWK
jgi:hypothetical protein